MPDREKAIKGLECHRIDNNHRINCADCPYYVDDDNHIRCVNDLHDDAIALLKEQESVKPVLDEQTGRIWLCGKCGTYVGFEDNDPNDPNEFDKYCRECGRPVLWEGRWLDD